MQIVTRLEMLRSTLVNLRESGQSAQKLALVPTMGALHSGHISLIKEAKKHAAQIVVSIFVNPAQFGANEDLEAYPRQWEADCRLLEEEGGVDVLWAPDTDQIYPAGFSTNIRVAGVSEGFCGDQRPGHFDGVATVVSKLFQQIQPDFAIFGAKDWQQFAVIRAMARDLNFTRPLPANIIAAPTMREADGLAMSSRNQYLSETDRRIAAALPKAMHFALSALAQVDGSAQDAGLGASHGSNFGANIEAGLGVDHEASVHQVLERLKHTLIEAGFDSVDYAGLADEDTLQAVSRLDNPKHTRLLVAARIGATRLIDNLPLRNSA